METTKLFLSARELYIILLKIIDQKEKKKKLPMSHRRFEEAGTLSFQQIYSPAFRKDPE